MKDHIRDEQYPYYWHLADDLFGIPLPMPSIIGLVNTFLVRSPERDLLIDRDEAGAYFAMLERLKELLVNVVYSGHNNKMTPQGFRDECDRQYEHHQRRMMDAYRIVQSGHHHMMDILYHYAYLRKRRHWEDCHDIMRWDLLVEMAGYLNHLVHEGKLVMKQEGIDFYFYLNPEKD